MSTHANTILRALRLPFLLVVAAVTVVAVAVMAFGPPTTLTTGFSAPQPQETETDPPAAEVTADLDDVTFRVTTYEVFLSRDPFARVIPEPAAPAPAPGESPVPGTDPGDPTDPTDPGELPSTNGEECVQNAELVCNGRVVTVIDIFTDDDGTLTAVIRVNDTLYEVVEGDQFLTFRVDRIDPPCVELMNGDADTFRICEGEAVLK
jgi:hypothetical protein